MSYWALSCDDVEELAKAVRHDPAVAKLRLELGIKIATANASGLLKHTDDQGRPLYRVTSGGNLVRTKPVKPWLKKRILRRDGYACVECGAVDEGARSLEIAHIEAYRVRGNNDEDNLRTLCWDCHNLERGT